MTKMHLKQRKTAQISALGYRFLNTISTIRSLVPGAAPTAAAGALCRAAHAGRAVLSSFCVILTSFPFKNHTLDELIVYGYFNYTSFGIYGLDVY